MLMSISTGKCWTCEWSPVEHFRMKDQFDPPPKHSGSINSVIWFMKINHSVTLNIALYHLKSI